MEKAFDLKPKELQTLQGLENDNLRANATYGVLARQMDECKQKITASEEAQRAFVRTVLSDRGVDQFQNARVEAPGRIVATLFDEVNPTPAPAPKPNGGFGQPVEGSENAV